MGGGGGRELKSYHPRFIETHILYIIFFFVLLVHTRNEKQDGNKFIILK